LSPHNPDAARHFCTSARWVIVTMLDSSAPDADVARADPDCEVPDKGVPTRRAKIRHLRQRPGVTVGGSTDLLEKDMINVLSLFRAFNDGTHGHAGRFTITELSAIRTRVESAIGFIHQVIAPTR
jgi:Predicted pPIWI-associating nuclease